jgi:hypothetical protein
MDINQLTTELINFAKKEDEYNDTLTLYQLETFLKEKNIYFETFYSFYINDVDCYLIILFNETWYYALGSSYFRDDINFVFYVDNHIFSELKLGDIYQLKNTFNKFKENMEKIIQTLEDPNSIKRITLQRTFSSFNEKI